MGGIVADSQIHEYSLGKFYPSIKPADDFNNRYILTCIARNLLKR
jgi:hypothetical protein